MICDHTKLHTCLIITEIEPKAKYIFRPAAAIFLSYILQKELPQKSCIVFEVLLPYKIS